MKNSNTNDVSRRCDDLERGMQTSGIATGGVRMKDNTSSDESNSHTSISLPSGDFKDDDDENDAFRAKQRALNVIADLDLGTPTKSYKSA
jgi:hypothetical protein